MAKSPLDRINEIVHDFDCAAFEAALNHPREEAFRDQYIPRRKPSNCVDTTAVRVVEPKLLG